MPTKDDEPKVIDYSGNRPGTPKPPDSPSKKSPIKSSRSLPALSEFATLSAHNSPEGSPQPDEAEDIDQAVSLLLPNDRFYLTRIPEGISRNNQSRKDMLWLAQEAFDHIAKTEHIMASGKPIHLDWGTAHPVSHGPYEKTINEQKDNLGLKEEAKRKEFRDKSRRSSIYNKEVVDPEIAICVAKYFKRNHGAKYTNEEGESSKIIFGNKTLEIIERIFEIPKIKKGTLLLPIPTFGRYLQPIQNSGIKTVLVDTDRGILNVDNLKTEVEKRPKDEQITILINYPNNPTSCNMSKKTLWELKKLTDAFPNVLIISDEIFQKVQLSNKHRNYSASSFMPDRAIVTSGVSKTFGMPNSRISFATMPSQSLAAEYSGSKTDDRHSILPMILDDSMLNIKYLEHDIISNHVKKIEIIKEELGKLNAKLRAHFKDRDSSKEYFTFYNQSPEATNSVLIDCSNLAEKEVMPAEEDKKSAKKEVQHLDNGVKLAKFLFNKAGVNMLCGEAFFVDPKDSIAVRLPLAVNKKELSHGFDKIFNAIEQNLTNAKVIKRSWVDIVKASGTPESNGPKQP